jgi:hypothetical protein
MHRIQPVPFVCFFHWYSTANFCRVYILKHFILILVFVSEKDKILFACVQKLD